MRADFQRSVLLFSSFTESLTENWQRNLESTKTTLLPVNPTDPASVEGSQILPAYGTSSSAGQNNFYLQNLQANLKLLGHGNASQPPQQNENNNGQKVFETGSNVSSNATLPKTNSSSVPKLSGHAEEGMVFVYLIH